MKSVSVGQASNGGGVAWPDMRTSTFSCAITAAPSPASAIAPETLPPAIVLPALAISSLLPMWSACQCVLIDVADRLVGDLAGSPRAARLRPARASCRRRARRRRRLARWCCRRRRRACRCRRARARRRARTGPGSCACSAACCDAGAPSAAASSRARAHDARSAALVDSIRPPSASRRKWLLVM